MLLSTMRDCDHMTGEIRCGTKDFVKPYKIIGGIASVTIDLCFSHKETISIQKPHWEFEVIH